MPRLYAGTRKNLFIVPSYERRAERRSLVHSRLGPNWHSRSQPLVSGEALRAAPGRQTHAAGQRRQGAVHQIDLECAYCAATSIHGIEEASAAFRCDRQIVWPGAACSNAVDQRYGTSVANRVAGDAGTQVVSNECEPSGDRFKRNPASCGSTIVDIRADRRQVTIMADSE